MQTYRGVEYRIGSMSMFFQLLLPVFIRIPNDMPIYPVSIDKTNMPFGMEKYTWNSGIIKYSYQEAEKRCKKLIDSILGLELEKY